MSLRSLLRQRAVSLATSDGLERAVVSAPVTRRIALRRALRYVAGVDERAALTVVEDLSLAGLTASLDLFGENTDDPAEADAVVERYRALVGMLGGHPGTYLSLDCSHLALDRDPAACLARVLRIAERLPADARLQLGAEEATRTDAIVQLARDASASGARVMQTVQANLRRSAADVELLAQQGIPVRLVKGAYPERPGIAYPWGAETDRSYRVLAARLRTLGVDHSLATHDPALLDELLRGRDGATVEFLLGVRPEHARELVDAGHRVRVYVPYGERWFRYYARRAAESIGA
ncbi:MAG TPA: proline dehydrogenase family protein [Gaiellales bacterium]|jgi:proline dehydrogenase